MEAFHVMHLLRPQAPPALLAARDSILTKAVSNVPCISDLDRAWLEENLPLASVTAVFDRNFGDEGIRCKDSLAADLLALLPGARRIGAAGLRLMVLFLRHLLRRLPLTPPPQMTSALIAAAVDAGGTPPPASANKADPPSVGCQSVVKVSTGLDHSLAVTKSGTLYGWGRADGGRLWTDRDEVASATESEVAVVARRRRDVWGRFCAARQLPLPPSSGSDGVLPLGSQLNVATPARVSGPLLGLSFVDAACGSDYSLAVTAEGAVFSWGLNGRPTAGTSTCALRPQRVLGALVGRQVVQVACGESHSLALCKSGVVYAWGRGDDGRLGLGPLPHLAVSRGGSAWVEMPAVVDGALRGLACVQVACGSHHSAAVTADGALFVWGAAKSGRLGLGRFPKIELPAQAAVQEAQANAVVSGGSSCSVDSPALIGGLLSERRVAVVACGGAATAVLTADGQCLAWGKGVSYQQCTRPANLTSTAQVMKIEGCESDTTKLRSAAESLMPAVLPGSLASVAPGLFSLGIESAATPIQQQPSLTSLESARFAAPFAFGSVAGAFSSQQISRVSDSAENLLSHQQPSPPVDSGDLASTSSGSAPNTAVC